MEEFRAAQNPSGYPLQPPIGLKKLKNHHEPELIKSFTNILGSLKQGTDGHIVDHLKRKDRMPPFLGLAGLLLFRLILVALVVGDALVNALEEMPGKLRDLGFTLLSIFLVKVLFHDPVAAKKELPIGIECCDYAAWTDGVL